LDGGTRCVQSPARLPSNIIGASAGGMYVRAPRRYVDSFQIEKPLIVQ
jgi:hypothetical protein